MTNISPQVIVISVLFFVFFVALLWSLWASFVDDLTEALNSQAGGFDRLPASMNMNLPTGIKRLIGLVITPETEAECKSTLALGPTTDPAGCPWIQPLPAGTISYLWPTESGPLTVIDGAETPGLTPPESAA